MTDPYYRDDSIELHHGDSRIVAASLPAASVDCVITSPAYFWQRDYGVEGQFGMEPTIDGFVDNVVQTFGALRHTLRPGATVWLNLGDTYYSAKGRPHGVDPKHRSRRMQMLRAVDGPGLGLPRKSLIGIPWRVAIAMQSAGWTLRSDIIWSRSSAMPEPTARDRPWRSKEYLFLFSAGPRYYFDRSALQGAEDIWVIEPERNHAARGKHYAPFPKELPRRAIAAGCLPGGVVLDPFAGGGTTLEVASMMGRKAVGIELSGEFCADMAARFGALLTPGVAS